MIHEPADNDDPCCDECLAWATGADVDEQTKQHALQDAINATHERIWMQWAQQGVFLRKRDEA